MQVQKMANPWISTPPMIQRCIFARNKVGNLVTAHNLNTTWDLEILKTVTKNRYHEKDPYNSLGFWICLK